MPTIPLDTPRFNLQKQAHGREILRSFAQPTKKTGPLAKALPSGQTATSKIVDVVGKYAWSNTPLGSFARKNAPNILLFERKLLKNALINQALYYVYALNDVVGSSNSNLPSVTPAGQSIVQDIYSTLATATKDILGPITQTVSNAMSLQSLAGDLGDPIGLNDKSVSPYQSLYISKLTGVVYNLPYFGDLFRHSTNSFSDSYDGPNPLGGLLTGDILNKAGKDMSEIAGWASVISQPGTFIERPKFYDFRGQGETFEVNFPLLNTVDIGASLIQNYEFIIKLLKANRPYRKNKFLIDPPHLYEVLIPGTRYVPYAYISGLNINFIGNKRKLRVQLNVDEGIKGVKEIIVPDAFNIIITFTSLVTESGNFIDAMFNISDKISAQ
jgi:hypothetical protein